MLSKNYKKIFLDIRKQKKKKFMPAADGEVNKDQASSSKINVRYDRSSIHDIC